MFEGKCQTDRAYMTSNEFKNVSGWKLRTDGPGKKSRDFFVLCDFCWKREMKGKSKRGSCGDVAMEIQRVGAREKED